jgi:hypothetical protein
MQGRAEGRRKKSVAIRKDEEMDGEVVAWNDACPEFSAALPSSERECLSSEEFV